MIVFFCAFFLRVQITYAQAPLIFKSINVDNGLPQNTVLSVLQDKKGYLWVATYDGLSKYNGLEFKVYKNEINNVNSISNNKVNKLFEDKIGRIWVGTVDGLNLFDPEKESFTRFKISGSNQGCTVLSIAEDSKEVLWIGTNSGLFYVDTRNIKPKNTVITRSAICRDKKTECLYIDRDKHLWIGSGQTLKIYDPVKARLLSVPVQLKQSKELAGTVIRNISQDVDNNYWIATETNGLFYYNAKTANCINYDQNNGLLSNTVRAVLETGNHIIWVGTKKGLNIINTQTGDISGYSNDPFNPNSLSQNSIRDIFKDNESNVWIGTFNGGLNCVYSQFDNFYYLGLKKGGSNNLSYDIINAIFQDRDGNFWVGTDDGGLNKVDNGLQYNHSYYQYNGASRELLGNSIKSIAEHTDPNKLWIATGSGLSVFDKRTNAFENTHILPKPNVPGFIQNFVLLKDKGGMWIGTNFSGLYYLENSGALHSYHTTENRILALYKDGNDLWVGTADNGLNHLDIGTKVLTSYRANPNKSNNLTNDAVLSVFKDSHQRLWIGTDGGGMNYFDTKTRKFYSITETQGIANNTIHSILEDKSGRLWLSTNKGLSCIGFKKFNVSFDRDAVSVANYSVEDGLQSNQFTTGAALKANSGNLVFGGINGLTAFDPARIKINKVKPAIVFTDFLILNKPVSFNVQGAPLQKPIDETDEITLNHGQTFFSIKFAALNYINPQKNQFAFKLDGFSDNDWHYVGNQQMATYTNLDPGTYYFKLKAANNDGIWNNSPRVLKINILPPWWKTYYAYAGYLALVICLLYLFNIYSKKTERLKNDLKYESINHAKDQELARKQLSFFVNISHEIKTPLTMIMAPLEKMIEMNLGNNKLQHQLGLMQRNGERLMRLVNQLLDKKKLETGHMYIQAAEADIVGFVQEIVLAFNGLGRAKNISIKLDTDVDELKICFDGDKLEKVFYNLLSNAIKFTYNYGRIVVRISQPANEDVVAIAVEDNGCGIFPENIDKIFTQFYHNSNLRIEGTGLGLAFSKELVGLHYGKLEVESMPETIGKKGFTKFTVKLPLGKAHFKQDELNAKFTDSEDVLSYQYTERPIKSQLQLKKIEILNREARESFSMLIIEDNEDVLNFIKAGFEGDFEVHTALNGLSGFKAAKEIIPDIIISDVMMPGQNGMELCQEIKSDVYTSHIPVILLTARTQFIFKMEGIETGADDYITKPFNFSMLEARVWNLIETRQKLRQRYRREVKLDPQNITINNLDEAFLNKMLNYIELHITNPELSVEQLSQEVAMSRSSFYKKIKSLTNQTGVEFIRSIRIKRAAQLLANGQFTVNEVAYMVGFLDVNYFRKCFKEQFSHTPREHPLSKLDELQ